MTGLCCFWQEGTFYTHGRRKIWTILSVF